MFAVFCYAMFCCYCASYTNRKEALRGDMTRYTCCMGMWPCSGKMGEKNAPECCLCLEVLPLYASDCSLHTHSLEWTRFL